MKKYRLKPIIIGYRLEGYELQKSVRFLFFFRKWIAVRGESGRIQCRKNDKQTIEQIKKELEELSEHLQTPIYL